MTPEQLVERMAEASKKLNSKNKVITFRMDAECMLRIVLSEIEKGEVVDANGRCFAELKPSFKAFMGENQ